MNRFQERPDAPGTVFSVAEVNANVRAMLEAGFSRICVEAEVGEVKRAQSGHVYFTLTDKDGRAQLPAVMWRGQALRYGSRLVTGTLLHCVGRLTLYEARGSFQMSVERVEAAGAGAKAQQLEALKKKLFEEGLFNPERKKNLPPFPAVLGVVTSRQGAAFRDIVKVARRRFPVRIVIAHAQVQGEGAPSEIASALRRLDAMDSVDVIIVGRGGGSAEDLDAFNDEAVVRAAAACVKPVISAVGHEIDTSLTDLVADRRAATPSEAAEIAVPDGRLLGERLAQGADALTFAMRRMLSERHRALALIKAEVRSRDPRIRLRRAAEVLQRSREVLLRKPEALLAACRADLTRVAAPLASWPSPRLLNARGALLRMDDALLAFGERMTDAPRARLAQHAARLEALSPLASLSRGYAVVQRFDDGRILRRAKDAPPGTEVSVTLAEGVLECRVTKTRADEIVRPRGVGKSG